MLSLAVAADRAPATGLPIRWATRRSVSRGTPAVVRGPPGMPGSGRPPTGQAVGRNGTSRATGRRAAGTDRQTGRIGGLTDTAAVPGRWAPEAPGAVGCWRALPADGREPPPRSCGTALTASHRAGTPLAGPAKGRAGGEVGAGGLSGATTPDHSPTGR
ncbi:hypothetical protein GCM10020358_01840 [Amorphoplanes nipponensis]